MDQLELLLLYVSYKTVVLIIVLKMHHRLSNENSSNHLLKIVIRRSKLCKIMHNKLLNVVLALEKIE